MTTTTTSSDAARCPFHRATALVRRAPAALAPRRVPGPRGFAWVAMLRGLMRQPLDQLRDAHAEHGDLFCFGMGPLPSIYFVADPDAARRVLVERAAKYVKSRTYDGMRCFAGDGLITNAGGDAHKRQRRLASPAFHRGRVAMLATRMAEETARALSGVEDRGEVDLHDEMMRLTLTIVGRTLFDVDLSGDRALGGAFAEVIRFANAYAVAPVRLPLSWPTPSNRRFLRARAVLDGLVDRLIAERRASCADRGDLMSTLMAARDESGAMDDRQLRDEIMTMLAAGHETTANAMSWLFHLLAQHPDVQERVRDEVRGALGDRAPDMEDLARLPYTGMVVSETLRLYPTAWMIERTPLEDDEILGHRVPAGSIVAVSPYVLHRHPAHWDDPDRFDPERFGAGAASRPRHAYIPFGAGPRVCIGAQFSTVEMQIIAAMIVARFRITPAPGHEVVPEASVTLRPRHGLRVHLSRV